MNCFRWMVLLGLTFAVSGAYAAAQDGTPPVEQDAKCTSVLWQGQDSVDGAIQRTVDGDTAKVRIDGKTYSVRFLLIDTPETHFEGQSQGFWGERAAERLSELLPPSAPVRIEFGPERCDSYGRILGYVWSKGGSVNLQMVTEGLAVTFCLAPNLMYCRKYADASVEAINAKRGMHSDPTVLPAYEWRRIVSGRPLHRYVGDLYTMKVYVPEKQDTVPLGNRVFFSRASDIHPPFSLQP